MAWKTSYYHFDAMGSTRRLTGADQSVLASYSQTAFGEQLLNPGIVNPFRFIGQIGYYFDATSGLFYVRQRVYDAATARWLSQDPARSDQNLFRYAQNSVLQRTDPSGLWGPAGHFWTTYMVAYTVRKKKKDEAYLLAYYSQYPDQDKNYDATTQGERALTVLALSTPSSNDSLFVGPQSKEQADMLKQSEKVYNALHTIAGLDAAGLDRRRVVLRSLFQSNSGSLKRQGLLLHPLGDAYAHVRDNGEGYSWFEGHYFDNHTPDSIKDNITNYENYVCELYKILGGKDNPRQNSDIAKIFATARGLTPVAQMTREEQEVTLASEARAFRDLARDNFGYTFNYIPDDKFSRDPRISDVPEAEMNSLMNEIIAADRAAAQLAPKKGNTTATSIEPSQSDYPPNVPTATDFFGTLPAMR